MDQSGRVAEENYWNLQKGVNDENWCIFCHLSEIAI
jgi:hypothetical protein